MTKSLTHVNRTVAMVCALAVGFACVPSAAWARDEARAEPRAVIRASAERVAAAESHRMTQAKRSNGARHATGQPQGQPAPELESGSFFRRPAGVAVLAVFGIGVGYALYSVSNDRIRSSGR